MLSLVQSTIHVSCKIHHAIFFIFGMPVTGTETVSISERKAGISTLYGFSTEGEMFPVGSYKWGF